MARATTGTLTLSRLAEPLPPSRVAPHPATVLVAPEAGSEPEAGRLAKAMLPPAETGVDSFQMATS